eukprot:gnl/TRDRNA2_/TRDRNA2_59027_c0_seq1.p1 gnl/TRDRNA2_/TRDRNA2_59027_c0~~gnl/TRDRNA2_/TRDRNA2_59027_c0_seq1.p1  ORF type:complete len:322 (+),score=67.48 gnl/TRDRNA2_/TRDRNA2_59027_c0_seq1:180-1145(+)
MQLAWLAFSFASFAALPACGARLRNFIERRVPIWVNGTVTWDDEVPGLLQNARQPLGDQFFMDEVNAETFGFDGAGKEEWYFRGPGVSSATARSTPEDERRSWYEDQNTKPSFKCNPACGWSCGKKVCDATCEAMCTPPQCMTLCAKTADKCETRCGEPRCAVVCPSTAQVCSNGDCPKCRTVCAPPACTTQCVDNCDTVCSKPSCSWKCKEPEKCPEPKCEMKCAGLKKCGSKMKPWPIPQVPGKTIVAKGKASLEPKTLFDPIKPPKPWKTPGGPKGSSAARPTISPIRQLKNKYEKIDEAKEEAMAEKRRAFERSLLR